MFGFISFYIKTQYTTGNSRVEVSKMVILLVIKINVDTKLDGERFW